MSLRKLMGPEVGRGADASSASGGAMPRERCYRGNEREGAKKTWSSPSRNSHQLANEDTSNERNEGARDG